ncbi:unnamed protein product, partial [Heterotrigona itama]
HERLIVGEPDGLPDPAAVQLAVVPDVVLPDELPAATDADMLLLHLHAHQIVAHGPRQRRKSPRKETSHQAGLRRRWRIRILLVILVTKSLDVYPLTSATIMVQIASHILAYTNSCVNPILYAFLSDSFRKAFRKIIYCRPRPDQNRQLGPLTKTTRAASTGATCIAVGVDLQVEYTRPPRLLALTSITLASHPISPSILPRIYIWMKGAIESYDHAKNANFAARLMRFPLRPFEQNRYALGFPRTASKSQD